MSKVWSLFKYETYKILHNKLTIIVIALMVILTILMGVPLGQGNQTKEVHKAMLSMDGHIIDNNLMEEMNSSINRTDPDWNPDTWKWTGLNYIVALVESSSEQVKTADQFYDLRANSQLKGMTEDHLTDGEIAWWGDKENVIKKPFTYISSYNARSLVDYIYNVLLLSLLLAAVCLSTVFAGEHRRGMDQIILSTKHGRCETFLAKLMAGFIFILVWTAILTALLVITIYAFSGLSGLKAIVQMEVPTSAYPLTFLQFFGSQLLILFSAAILFAAISMAFSEFLRNGIAVMGLMIGFYLATQFISIPKSIRLLSQTVAMLPTELINIWTLYDHRLVSIFGQYHTMLAVAPIIYILISVILCSIAWQAYRRYQVCGR